MVGCTNMQPSPTPWSSFQRWSAATAQLGVGCQILQCLALTPTQLRQLSVRHCLTAPEEGRTCPPNTQRQSPDQVLLRDASHDIRRVDVRYVTRHDSRRHGEMPLGEIWRCCLPPHPVKQGRGHTWLTKKRPTLIMPAVHRRRSARTRKYR